MNKLDWQSEEMPEDRVILRWHLVWNVPMAVKYMPDSGFQHQSAESLPWIEASYTTAWPEIAFSPYWAELPGPPPNFDADAEAIKAPKLETFEDIK